MADAVDIVKRGDSIVKGDSAGALALYDMAIKADSGCFQAYLQKGKLLHVLGKHGDAAECLEHAIMVEPGNVNAYLLKGKALTAMRNHKEAADCFESAIWIDPGNAILYREKSESLYWLKDFGSAIKHINTAIWIDSSDPECHLIKGMALHERGDCAEAIKCYDAALEINPTFVDGFIYKGICLLDSGRSTEALAAFDHIDVEPLEYRSWIILHKVKALYNLGRPKEAIAYLDTIKNGDEFYDDAQLEKGMISKMLHYIERDDHMLDQAMLCHEKLAKENPQLAVRLYMEGLDLYTGGNIKKAQKRFSDAAFLRPGFPDAVCAIAMAFHTDEYPEPGIRCCNLALKIDPTFVPALCAKAKILRDMGKTSESDSVLGKAYRLDPGLSDHDDIIGMLRERL